MQKTTPSHLFGFVVDLGTQYFGEGMEDHAIDIGGGWPKLIKP